MNEYDGMCIGAKVQVSSNTFQKGKSEIEIIRQGQYNQKPIEGAGIEFFGFQHRNRKAIGNKTNHTCDDLNNT